MTLKLDPSKSNLLWLDNNTETIVENVWICNDGLQNIRYLMYSETEELSIVQI